MVGEAMMCGTPVVSTPVGVVPEVLRDGWNGYLVSWDRQEITERVSKILEDVELRSHLGRNATATAAARFEWNNVLKHYAKAVEEFVEARRRTSLS